MAEPFTCNLGVAEGQRPESHSLLRAPQVTWMNLSRLKKSRLVELCYETDLDTRGKIPDLKQRLIRLGHWDLKYVRTRGGSRSPYRYSDTEQVSKEEINSFEVWLKYLRERLEKDHLDLELDPCLRDYFDRDVHPRSVYYFIKKGWTFEQGMEFVRMQG